MGDSVNEFQRGGTPIPVEIAQKTTNHAIVLISNYN